MKILYLDCFSGISGDMCLGALIDAGADAGRLERDLRSLPLEGWDMRVTKEGSHGITGTRVKISVSEERQPHRHYTGIRDMIMNSALPEGPREAAARVFRRLARAEGKVHGVPAEKVHFHEVGAVDSILDIVGTALALYYLEVDRVACSPVPTGTGHVRCRHGLLPVPAPATAELLKGIPLRSLDVQGELTTPTGAALAAELAGSFGPLPEMEIEAVGYGLGSRDYGIPNFLRVFLGSQDARECDPEAKDVLVMETAIDDINPQMLGHVMESLLAGGALDVFFTPVYMKKNRPGCLITVLCRPGDKDPLARLLFEETTTLGIRFRKEQRMVLGREMIEVNTPYGCVRIKNALDNDGRRLKSAPEYEDCRRIAREKGIPARVVYEAALLAVLNESRKTL